MADHANREHYIPIRKTDLVDVLKKDRRLNADERENFGRFCELLSATMHYEYLSRKNTMKDQYAPFDPEANTVQLVTYHEENRDLSIDALFRSVDELMQRANFTKLSRAHIEEATQIASAGGINLEVDFDAFERIEIYVRGEAVGERFKRRWYAPWIRDRIEIPFYQRLALIVKLSRSKRFPEGVDTDDVFLKYFKDIPKADLEMMLPGSRVVMPGIMRLKLGSSLLSGLGLIAYNVIKQLLTAAALGVQYFYGPLIAMFGYGWRQYYGYQSSKTTCNLRLTQSLYFQNLANNSGVVTFLLDEAEEQDLREAILAYHSLWQNAGPAGWTMDQLDNHIEAELERLAGVKVDFEVDDALEKLVRLKLVTRFGNAYAAMPIRKALDTLDETWDNYFQYNNEAKAKETLKLPRETATPLRKSS